MRKSFELWLDESGTFENDNLVVKNKMPSHVGGILYDRDEDLRPILAIAPEDGFHATENADAEYVFSRFQKISEQKLKLVLFQNAERLVIVDDKLTYLEIITEGILEVIKRLKAAYGDIHLKVFVAIRKDNPKAEKIATESGGNPGDYFVEIKSNDYIKQLKSKILVNGLNSGIKDDEWSIEFGSARHDKKLLLCDVVCNVFFTKDTKIKNKVGKDASAFVNHIYEDPEKTWKFSVLSDPETEFFYKYMGENRIGEAVSVICQGKSKESIKRCMNEIGSRISGLSSSDLERQYRFIADQIQYFLTISREFEKCESFLLNLNEHLIPILYKMPSNEQTRMAQRLEFDIYFSLDTVYSHTGNVNASAVCEEECDKLIPQLPQGFETINYLINYRLRKIQSQINRFDFEGAEISCTKQIEQCVNMKSAMLLAVDNYDMNYSELAKAYSMRCQIRTFLLREDPAKYQCAKEDSDHAINEFEYEYDIRRHYLTRVQLETEASEERSALEYLSRAFSVGEEERNAIAVIASQLSKRNPFEVMAYYRVMGEGYLRGFSYAKKMFEEAVRNHVQPDSGDEKANTHPYEIIFWKYATVLALKGNLRAAIKYYERAAQICLDEQEKELTLMCIGLAIEAEMIYFLKKEEEKESRHAEKKIRRDYQRFLSYKPPETMKRLFIGLDKMEGEVLSAEDYFMISRRITY